MLDVYPALDGIQVLDANGQFVMGERGGAQWMSDSTEVREGIKRALRRYDVFSESNFNGAIYFRCRKFPHAQAIKTIPAVAASCLIFDGG